MECLRHGTVELVSTVNNTVKGALHFLSCGCFGTAEQLRDPDYNPNPPAEPHPADVAKDARIAELEAAHAEALATIDAHVETLAGHEATIAGQTEAIEAHVATVEELQARLAEKDAQIASLEAAAKASEPAGNAHVEPGASLFSDPAQVAPTAPAEAPAAEPPAIEGAA